MNLTKTPYLVLFILLAAAGVGTASALLTITFEGLTIFKENAQFDKDVNIDGIVTGQAITDFQNQIDNNEARITDIELFLEERSDFWEFLEESGEEFFESQIYEVSGVSIIEAGTGVGSLVQLRCLDGDSFIQGQANTVLSVDPSVNRAVQRSDFTQIFENVPNISGSRIIGADVAASLASPPQETFDITVTITGLCLSPSP